jgi:hypothetical protein
MRIALDIGSGYVKAKLKAKRISFPSAVGQIDAKDIENSFLDENDSTLLCTKENQWLYGQSAIGNIHPDKHSNTLNQNWCLSDGHLVLIYAAIAELIGKSYTGNIVLYTGIPAKTYFKNKAKFVEKLVGKHQFTVGELKFSITIKDENAVVLPQAYGLFASEMLSTQPKDLEQFKCRRAYIDIGTYTTGLAMVMNKQLEQWTTGGVELGGSNLASKIQQYCYSNYGYTPSKNEVYDILISGHIVNCGKTLNIEEQIIGFARELCHENGLFVEIEKLWGKAKNAVIKLGGGPSRYFFLPLKEVLPHIEMVTGEDTIWSVLDGIDSYMRAKESVTKKSKATA